MTSVIDGLKDLTASSTSTGPAGMWCTDTHAGTHINNFVKKKKSNLTLGVCVLLECVRPPGFDSSTAKESRDSFNLLKFCFIWRAFIKSNNGCEESLNSYHLFGGCYSKGV